MGYPKGKLTTSNSAANILTDFNPSSFYTNNGNYLKFVVYVDWTNTPMSNAYLFSGEREWFTVENYSSGGIYFNMGTGGTGLGANLATNTQEFEKPMTVILNNGVASFEQDGNTASVSFSALTPTTFTLWRTNNGYNFRGSFYGFEVYDRDGNMAHNYIPWQDANNTPCVVDAVTDNVFYPSGTNYQLVYESLVNFYPSQDTFTFNANGGTQTFTVEATNAWTCTSPTDFVVSPMSGTAGTTTVTITAPRRISTVNNTVTFTDSQSNTFDISISQSVGTITPNLTLYQGAATVKKMYYGSGLVYRKMAHSPSLVISGDSFTFPPTSYTAATVAVTTDANWSYSTEANWLSLTKTGNNLEIVPTSDWDQGSAPRTATVTVKADNGFITKTAEISVKQKNTNAENVDWVTTTYSQGKNTCIDSGIYPTTDTVMKIKYKPIATNGGALVGFAPGNDTTPTGSADDNSDYRYFYYNSLTTGYFDFNSSRINKSLSYDAEGYMTVEIGNNYITNNTSTYTGTTQSSMATTGVPIYINMGSNAQLQSVEIWQGQTKVYDGHAAFDGENYGWSDSISGTFTTQTYGGYALTGPSI